MPAADQPGLALCRKTKIAVKRGEEDGLPCLAFAAKKGALKTFQNRKSPLAACEYIAAVVTVIPFPRKKIHVRPPDHCLIGMLMQDLPAVPWKLPSLLGSALMKDLR